MQNLIENIAFKHTLECGQIFRFSQEDGGYRILHKDASFFVKQNGKLEFEGISKQRLSDFFRLDDDYGSILVDIDKDQTINKALQQFVGLRIIRQDPWECAVSFLCSMASNIPKIKWNLSRIADTFGAKCDDYKNVYNTFPKIGEIDDLNKLKECGVGFRARYIYSFNNSVTYSFFNKLKRLPYEDAKHELMQFSGIGPKVADCILLFSLDHLSSFPIDTWMEKVMRDHYGQHLKKRTIKNMHMFAQDYFGRYAGYAQEFLYHWKRNNGKKQ